MPSAEQGLDRNEPMHPVMIRYHGAVCTRALENAYPKLNETLGIALEAEETDPVAARKLWAEAVEIEMHRVHHEPIAADTEIGRRIQHQTGMSGVVANRIVRKAGKELLESLETVSKRKQ